MGSREWRGGKTAGDRSKCWHGRFAHEKEGAEIYMRYRYHGVNKCMCASFRWHARRVGDGLYYYVGKKQGC